MKDQKTIRDKGMDNRIGYSSQSSQKSYYSDRRQQEMKRRFGILQSRRSHLERELKAIKTGLSQLDHQMQSYLAHKQLSIEKQTTSRS